MPRKKQTPTTPPPEPERLYTVTEISRETGKPYETVRDNIRRGYLTPDAYKRPETRTIPLFRWATVQHWLMNPPARGWNAPNKRHTAAE